METNWGRPRHIAVEVMMPVAIALIVGVVVLAIVLIGIIWSFLLLLPFYAFVGLAVLLLWRSRQKESAAAAEVAREAERQRLFNDQETHAWEAALKREQRNASKRKRTLRRFDDTRDPPQQ
jgi:hypothetical protein